MTRVLVVNTGSSSLKVAVIDDTDDVVARAHVQDWDGHDTSPIHEVVSRAGGIDAIGHRIVHGGTDLRDPTPIDAATEAAIEALIPLAPLHQPSGLAGVRAARQACPDVPAIACFDTAFHATMPPAATTYAVPTAWTTDLGIRRYGFHGLSHAWASRRAAAIVARPPPSLKIVVAHLGAGASLCAVAGGRSVDTTMGFTPLEGLVMATRSGTVDPGVILWLQRDRGWSIDEIDDALQHRSGLLGLSGRSGDMREIIRRRAAGDPQATLAFAVYVHRLRAGIAAMTASLGGLDVLVFTGGVGEHSAEVRSATAEGLGFLGVGIDEDANTREVSGDADADITAGSATRTLVIAAREDLEIATEVRAVVRRPT